MFKAVEAKEEAREWEVKLLRGSTPTWEEAIHTEHLPAHEAINIDRKLEMSEKKEGFVTSKPNH